MTVTWKLKGLFKGIDPEEAYEEIYGDGEGKTTQQIVDIARDEDSVIHKYFEWDDSIAGEKYRLQQAQVMVRNFVLVKPINEEKPEEKVTYRLVQADSSRESKYEPVSFFLKNEDEYQKLLKRALAQLESFKQAYKSLVELDGVFEEIDKLLTA